MYQTKLSCNEILRCVTKNLTCVWPTSKEWHSIRAYLNEHESNCEDYDGHGEWGNTDGFQNRKMLFVVKKAQFFFRKKFHQISTKNVLLLWVSLVGGLILKRFFCYVLLTSIGLFPLYADVAALLFSSPGRWELKFDLI